jgi:hypothetical protein
LHPGEMGRLWRHELRADERAVIDAARFPFQGRAGTTVLNVGSRTHGLEAETPEKGVDHESRARIVPP